MHSAILEKFVATLREALRNEELNSSFFDGLSQRFWPLEKMLHWAMFRATGPAMALWDKLHSVKR